MADLNAPNDVIQDNVQNADIIEKFVAYVNNNGHLVIIELPWEDNDEPLRLNTNLDVQQFLIELDDQVVIRGSKMIYALRNDGELSLIIPVPKAINYQRIEGRESIIDSSWELLVLGRRYDYYLVEQSIRSTKPLNLIESIAAVYDGSIVVCRGDNIYRLTLIRSGSLLYLTPSLIYSNHEDPVLYIRGGHVVTEHHVYRMQFTYNNDGIYLILKSQFRPDVDFKLLDAGEIHTEEMIYHHYYGPAGSYYTLYDIDGEEAVNPMSIIRVVDNMDEDNIIMGLFYLDDQGNLWTLVESGQVYRIEVLERNIADIAKVPSENLGAISYVVTGGDFYYCTGNRSLHLGNDAAFLVGSHLDEFKPAWIRKRAPASQ